MAETDGMDAMRQVEEEGGSSDSDISLSSPAPRDIRDMDDDNGEIGASVGGEDSGEVEGGNSEGVETGTGDVDALMSPSELVAPSSMPFRSPPPPPRRRPMRRSVTMPPPPPPQRSLSSKPTGTDSSNGSVDGEGGDDVEESVDEEVDGRERGYSRSSSMMVARESHGRLKMQRASSLSTPGRRKAVTMSENPLVTDVLNRSLTLAKEEGEKEKKKTEVQLDARDRGFSGVTLPDIEEQSETPTPKTPHGGFRSDEEDDGGMTSRFDVDDDTSSDDDEEDDSDGGRRTGGGEGGSEYSSPSAAVGLPSGSPMRAIAARITEVMRENQALMDERTVMIELYLRVVEGRDMSREELAIRNLQRLEAGKRAEEAEKVLKGLREELEGVTSALKSTGRKAEVFEAALQRLVQGTGNWVDDLESKWQSRVVGLENRFDEAQRSLHSSGRRLLHRTAMLREKEKDMRRQVERAEDDTKRERERRVAAEDAIGAAELRASEAEVGKARVEEERRRMEMQLKDANETVERWKRQCEQLEDAVRVAEARADEGELLLARAESLSGEKEVAVRRAAEEERRAAEERARSATHRAETLERALASSKEDLSKMEEMRQEMMQRVEELQKSEARGQALLIDAEQEAVRANKRAEELQLMLKKVEGRLEEEEQLRIATEGKLHDLEGRNRLLEDRTEESAEAKKQISTLQDKLDAAKEEASRSLVKLEEMTALRDRAVARAERAEEDRTKAEKERDSAEATRQRLELASREVDGAVHRHQVRVDELEATVQRLEEHVREGEVGRKRVEKELQEALDEVERKGLREREVSGELARVSARLEELEAARERQTQRVADAETALDRVEKACRSAESAKARAEARVAELETARDRLRQRVEEEAAAKERRDSVVEEGRSAQLRLEAALRDAESEQHRAIVAAREAEEEKGRLEKRFEEVNGSLRDAEARVVELEEEMGRKGDLIADLEATRDRLEGRLQDAENNVVRLRSAVEEAEEAQLRAEQEAHKAVTDRAAAEAKADEAEHQARRLTSDLHDAQLALSQASGDADARVEERVKEIEGRAAAAAEDWKRMEESLRLRAEAAERSAKRKEEAANARLADLQDVLKRERERLESAVAQRREVTVRLERVERELRTSKGFEERVKSVTASLEAEVAAAQKARKEDALVWEGERRRLVLGRTRAVLLAAARRLATISAVRAGAEIERNVDKIRSEAAVEREAAARALDRAEKIVDRADKVEEALIEARAREKELQEALEEAVGESEKQRRDAAEAIAKAESSSSEVTRLEDELQAANAARDAAESALAHAKHRIVDAEETVTALAASSHQHYTSPIPHFPSSAASSIVSSASSTTTTTTPSHPFHTPPQHSTPLHPTSSTSPAPPFPMSGQQTAGKVAVELKRLREEADMLRKRLRETERLAYAEQSLAKSARRGEEAARSAAAAVDRESRSGLEMIAASSQLGWSTPSPVRSDPKSLGEFGSDFGERSSQFSSHHQHQQQLLARGVQALQRHNAAMQAQLRTREEQVERLEDDLSRALEEVRDLTNRLEDANRIARGVRGVSPSPEAAGEKDGGEGDEVENGGEEPVDMEVLRRERDELREENEQLLQSAAMQAKRIHQLRQAAQRAASADGSEDEGERGGGSGEESGDEEEDGEEREMAEMMMLVEKREGQLAELRAEMDKMTISHRSLMQAAVLPPVSPRGDSGDEDEEEDSDRVRRLRGEIAEQRRVTVEVKRRLEEVRRQHLRAENLATRTMARSEEARSLIRTLQRQLIARLEQVKALEREASELRSQLKETEDRNAADAGAMAASVTSALQRARDELLETRRTLSETVRDAVAAREKVWERERETLEERAQRDAFKLQRSLRKSHHRAMSLAALLDRVREWWSMHATKVMQQWSAVHHAVDQLTAVHSSRRDLSSLSSSSQEISDLRVPWSDAAMAAIEAEPVGGEGMLDVVQAWRLRATETRERGERAIARLATAREELVRVISASSSTTVAIVSCAQRGKEDLELDGNTLHTLLTQGTKLTHIPEHQLLLPEEEKGDEEEEKGDGVVFVEDEVELEERGKEEGGLVHERDSSAHALWHGSPPPSQPPPLPPQRTPSHPLFAAPVEDESRSSSSSSEGKEVERKEVEKKKRGRGMRKKAPPPPLAAAIMRRKGKKGKKRVAPLPPVSALWEPMVVPKK